MKKLVILLLEEMAAALEDNLNIINNRQRMFLCHELNYAADRIFEKRCDRWKIKQHTRRLLEDLFFYDSDAQLTLSPSDAPWWIIKNQLINYWEQERELQEARIQALHLAINHIKTNGLP